MPKVFPQMNSAVADVEALNGMARSLERSEARRNGTTLTHARKAVSRKLGITAGALENFLYLRTKVVPHWLMGKVRAELIASLQLEASNLEHEIEIHRRAGARHSGDALASAEAQLATAREILRG